MIHTMGRLTLPVLLLASDFMLICSKWFNRSSSESGMATATPSANAYFNVRCLVTLMTRSEAAVCMILFQSAVMTTPVSVVVTCVSRCSALFLVSNLLPLMCT